MEEHFTQDRVRRPFLEKFKAEQKTEKVQLEEKLQVRVKPSYPEEFAWNGPVDVFGASTYVLP